MRVVEIIISPQGQARVQTRGFVGTACQEASKFIEQTLGQRLEERLTAEFYQGEVISQTRRQQLDAGA